MGCINDHYKYLSDTAMLWWVGGVDWFTPSLGKQWAVVAVAALMSPVVVLLAYVTRVLIPDFVAWWYEETINHKAREYWRRKCLGTGMTIPGAKVSIVIGFVFFFLVRFVVSLPGYYRFSVPAFVIALLVVHVVACFVGGRVPENRAAQVRYFRRFYTPTVTGVGLGIATVVLEFVLQVSTRALA
jgi:hypothetical protein